MEAPFLPTHDPSRHCAPNVRFALQAPLCGAVRSARPTGRGGHGPANARQGRANKRCARGTQAGDRDDDSRHLRAAKHNARSVLHILPAEGRPRARDAAPPCGLRSKSVPLSRRGENLQRVHGYVFVPHLTSANNFCHKKVYFKVYFLFAFRRFRSLKSAGLLVKKARTSAYSSDDRGHRTTPSATWCEHAVG